MKHRKYENNRMFLMRKGINSFQGKGKKVSREEIDKALKEFGKENIKQLKPNDNFNSARVFPDYDSGIEEFDIDIDA